MDDDEVAVEDAGVDHGVADDTQDEVAVVAAKEAGHVDELFDVLFRQQRDAGRHLADQRQGARRSELTHDLEGARLCRVAPDEALALEIGEVGMHGRRRRQLEGGADLAYRGRVAVGAHAFADEGQHLLLSCGQAAHVASSVEHMFVCSLG